MLGITAEQYRRGHINPNAIVAAKMSGQVTDPAEPRFFPKVEGQVPRDHGATGYALPGEPIRLPGTL